MEWLMRIAAVRQGKPAGWKVDGKTDLTADAWACNVSASEQTETEVESVADMVLATSHGLKLASAQIPVFRIGTEDLGSERELRGEVVEHRQSAGVDLAAGVLGSEHTCAG